MNTPQNSAPGNNDMGRKILLVALSCVGLAAVMMLGLFVTKFWILPQAIEQNKTAQAQQAAAQATQAAAQTAAAGGQKLEVPELVEQLKTVNQEALTKLETDLTPILQQLASQGKSNGEQVERSRQEIVAQITQVLDKQLVLNQKVQEQLVKEQKAHAEAMEQEIKNHKQEVTDMQEAFSRTLVAQQQQFDGKVLEQKDELDKQLARNHKQYNDLLLEFHNQCMTNYSLATSMREVYLRSLKDDSVLGQTVQMIKAPGGMIGAAIKGDFVSGDERKASETDLKDRFDQADKNMKDLLTRAAKAGVIPADQATPQPHS